ncbi:MAG: PAS domain S-box protein, partial [Methanoregula sp.]|nr:PAS domain S-box protein [Methanoregula sp.]
EDFRDITERKQAEDALSKKHEDLEAACEEITATEEELRQNYNDLSKTEKELRESERKYRDLVELLPQTVFELDDRGTITTVNPIALKSFGYTQEDFDKGMNAFEVIAPGDRDRARQNVQRVLNGEPLGGIEYTALRKDGSTFPVIIYTDAIIQNMRPVGIRGLLVDITERKRTETALNRATRKLNMLNSITFAEIQNAVFSLSGYFELEKLETKDEKMRPFLDKQIGIVRTITESLKFANNYQNLGLKSPEWQSIEQSFLFGISHIDISKLSRKLNVERLEIYADPLLENVFFTLAENVVLHGKTATEIALFYQETSDGLVLVFEDNGVGIYEDRKEKIFDRRYEDKKGMGLFLVREILEISGMTIKEIGKHGKGARFEIAVPKRAYRFAEKM